MKTKYIALFSILTAGFLFRLLFVKLFPQPFLYDQYEYLGFVLGMLKKGLHADTVRIYGYPVLMLPIVALFGYTNQWPYSIVQAVIDCATGILVYRIASEMFPTRRNSIAWLALLIYLCNPFTSAYTGVFLTEIVAIFLVTAIFYLFLTFFRDKKNIHGIILAFILGYLPQVRPSYIYFTIICLIVLCAFTIVQKRKKLVTIIAFLILYLLPYGYNIVTNIVHYRQFSFQSVDNVFAREVYVSLFINRGIPIHGQWIWPNEVSYAWWDFSQPQTEVERTAMTKKYFALSGEIIRKDPLTFIKTRIGKMFYLWEKHYLMPYKVESTDTRVNGLVYWGNIVLLVGAIGGFLIWIKRHDVREKHVSYMKIFIPFFILYVSISHIFSTSEERFSLPAYPIVILFFSYLLFSLHLFFHKRSFLK